MNNFFLYFVVFLFASSVFAENNKCLSKIEGYKLVKKTDFQFNVDNKKYCFFAFYTKNPNPGVDPRGNGNMGDSIWFAYYDMKNSYKIYELPKPSDIFWSNMCSVMAVSFYDMNGDKKPDITVIGSCERNFSNLSFPFVFFLEKNKYILDENLYSNLYGSSSLTISDIQKYIKTDGANYKELRNR